MRGLPAASLLFLLLAGACSQAEITHDPALKPIENAYKSGLMATVCFDERKGPADPALAAELRRRESLVRAARERGLGEEIEAWHAEWEALVAVADFTCGSDADMAAALGSWNDRLDAALKEYR